MKIHIIGGGNLGVAIALGILKYTTGNQVTVTKRYIEVISYLQEKGIEISNNNAHHIQHADIIVLTVKPHQVESVVKEISEKIQNKTIISAVSGVSIQTIQNLVNDNNAVMRIMPNIAGT